MGLPWLGKCAVWCGNGGCMLDELDLKRELTLKEEMLIKEEISQLGDRFSNLQQKLKKAGIPVVIVFEGWGSSGKGSLIGKLLKYLDPRGVAMHSITKPSDDEARKPYMTRFWLRLPGYGEIAIFDRSWYHDWNEAHLKEIERFERQLTDDGYMIFKFFLHISKKEQEKRLSRLEESKTTKWRVTDEDWEQNKHYAKCLRNFETLLEATDYDCAPWHPVSGMDKDEALRDVLDCLVENLEVMVDRAGKKSKEKGGRLLQGKGILPRHMDFAMEEKPKIQEVNLDCTLSEKEYRKRLDKLQDKLLKLSYKLYKKQIPLIICYEGWDAAGKGGNIKRLVSCFDARDYEVHPVAAPDIQEKNHHYLWRFWKNLPKNGHIEVFDRTWYGRVMVERLEGFNSKVEWQRAYNEINEFEEELTDWGAIVIKFWLQIDKDEQLARFTERQNNPAKQWKITDEDWRNREKWDAYEVAVNEMIQYTSTVNAPWHIIESNNKYYARIKAIETVVDAIEKRLGK